MGNIRQLAGALLLTSITPQLAAEGLTWGGDFRFRIEDLGTIPATGRNFDQLYNRDRSRLWLGYAPDNNINVMARLTNEFRFYDEDKQFSTAWDPFNELVPDNLYVEFKNLAGGLLNLRVGRQDLVYGNGNVILDGTPLDGSRTIYFNALKATLNFDAKHQLDVLAIYNEGRDPFTFNRQEGLRMIEQDESAFGVYGKHSQFEQLPFEYYWIYKQELNSLVDTKTKEKADARFHTLGGRIMPKLGNGLSANVELAFQTGDHGSKNVDGRMLDAALKFAPELEFFGSVKPAVTAGYYYLSGGQQGNGDDEGWHPVFSRWPQFSELYAFSWAGTQYSLGGWSNLKSPFVGIDLTPFPDGRFTLRYYKMYADENDGPGGGDQRGDLLTANLNFKLTRDLSGHVLGEWLNTGDYYLPGTADGRFLRLELLYKF